jgi:hypothetical protein
MLVCPLFVDLSIIVEITIRSTNRIKYIYFWFTVTPQSAGQTTKDNTMNIVYTGIVTFIVTTLVYTIIVLVILRYHFIFSRLSRVIVGLSHLECGRSWSRSLVELYLILHDLSHCLNISESDFCLTSSEHFSPIS